MRHLVESATTAGATATLVVAAALFLPVKTHAAGIDSAVEMLEALEVSNEAAAAPRFFAGLDETRASDLGGPSLGAALDAGSHELPETPFPRRLLAPEVLDGPDAWERGEGIGEPDARIAAFTDRQERVDVLDLRLDAAPRTTEDLVIDEVPGLSFERRMRYQESTGRLFVDFRLRRVDPAGERFDIEDDRRIADAVARMRSATGYVVEPANGLLLTEVE